MVLKYIWKRLFSVLIYFALARYWSLCAIISRDILITSGFISLVSSLFVPFNCILHRSLKLSWAIQIQAFVRLLHMPSIDFYKSDTDTFIWQIWDFLGSSKFLFKVTSSNNCKLIICDFIPINLWLSDICEIILFVVYKTMFSNTMNNHHQISGNKLND